MIITIMIVYYFELLIMSYLDVWLKYRNHDEKYFHRHDLIDSMIHPEKNVFK